MPLTWIFTELEEFGYSDFYIRTSTYHIIHERPNILTIRHFLKSEFIIFIKHILNFFIILYGGLHRIFEVTKFVHLKGSQNTSHIFYLEQI